MGGSLRKSAGTGDSSTVDGGGSEGGDAVTALPIATQQAMANERAEQANARLSKERKRASAEHAASPSSGHDSSRRRSKRSGSTSHHSHRTHSQSEPKWNKPPAAAVVAAALRDEDAEVETIDIGHSFAQTPSKSQHGGGHHASSPSATSFGGVVPSPNGGIGGPPPAMVNPWARTAVFQRDFAAESHDAELFVKLARDRTKVELKAQKKRNKSSIIQATIQAASPTHVTQPSQDEDDGTLTPPRQEEEDEFA